MPKGRKEKSASGQRQEVFKRARWKTVVRWFGLVMVVLLNLSLIAENVHLHSLNRIDLPHELLSYALLVFLDSFFLVPIIFEVDTATVTADKLILQTLLWKARVGWSEIVGLRVPLWLTFAILRTRRAFYLINRRDIANYEELVEIIEHQIGKASGSSSGH